MIPDFKTNLFVSFPRINGKINLDQNQLSFQSILVTVKASKLAHADAYMDWFVKIMLPRSCKAPTKEWLDGRKACL